MIYIVNVWQDSSNRGTACVFRGSRKADFEAAKKEAVERYGAHKDIARVVEVSKNLTVFSFADNAVAYRAWLKIRFTKKPLSVRWVRL